MGKKTSELEKEGGQTLTHGVQQEEMLHRRHQKQLAQLANTRTSHLPAPQTAFPLVLMDLEEPNAIKTIKCCPACNTTCSERAEQSSRTTRSPTWSLLFHHQRQHLHRTSKPHPRSHGADQFLAVWNLSLFIKFPNARPFVFLEVFNCRGMTLVWSLAPRHDEQLQFLPGAIKALVLAS